jgi:ABC-type lipoprotein export system ATPase subunit
VFSKSGIRQRTVSISGLVISKKSNPNRIVLRTLIDEVEVIVKDENTWNLIEKERTYFVAYFWKNNDMPTLVQIQHNDEFGKNYKEKLSK